MPNKKVYSLFSSTFCTFYPSNSTVFSSSHDIDWNDLSVSIHNSLTFNIWNSNFDGSKKYSVHTQAHLTWAVSTHSKIDLHKFSIIDDGPSGSFPFNELNTLQIIMKSVRFNVLFYHHQCSSNNNNDDNRKKTSK